MSQSAGAPGVQLPPEAIQSLMMGAGAPVPPAGIGGPPGMMPPGAAPAPMPGGSVIPGFQSTDPQAILAMQQADQQRLLMDQQAALAQAAASGAGAGLADPSLALTPGMASGPMPGDLAMAYGGPQYGSMQDESVALPGDSSLGGNSAAGSY